MTPNQFAQTILDNYNSGRAPNVVSFTAQNPLSLKVWQAMGIFEIVTLVGLEVAVTDAIQGGARGFRLDSDGGYSISYWLQ